MARAAPTHCTSPLAAIIALVSTAAAASAAPFAGPIDATTPEAVRIRGSDAIAGLGDWAISNGVLCAAVLGRDSEGQLVAGGGSLVDLGHCGRDDDQFIGAEPLYNLSRMEFLRVDSVRAEVDENRARIVTHAADGGIAIETEFLLDVEDPERIRIRSLLERRAEGDRFRGFAELVLNTNNALRNFTKNRVAPNEGFVHVDLNRSSYFEIADAIRSVSSTVLVGSDLQGPPIAYAYRVTKLERSDPAGRREALTHFGLNMDSVSLVHVFSEPLWVAGDELGIAQAVQAIWMDLEVGSSLIFEREIRVSRRSDVGWSTDRDAPSGRAVSGRVNDTAARVHIDRDEGVGFHPHTMLRTDPSGAFAMRLPPGRYRARVVAPAGRALEREFGVADEDLALAAFEFPESSSLRLPRGHAMRLVFRGLGDTATPRFGDDLTGATIGGQPRPNSALTSDVHLTGTPSDPRQIALAPGRYRVYATRGPEFSVEAVELGLRPGESARLEIDPPVRELETPGWISADFHVHAASSFDSTLPQRARVASFVAEGGEILVSTDHDVASDYAPTLRAMGLSGTLQSVSGLEVTSISQTRDTPHSNGHTNVFPVPYRRDQTRSGALRGEGLRLRELIASTRALPVASIVQLNHPRDSTGDEHGGSYFEHLAVAGEPFDPERPLSAWPNRVLLEPDPISGLRDVDFDAIELLNGQSLDEYPRVRRDWLSLLRQGIPITALANSDTHTLGNIVAVPRTYVRVADDRIAAFSESELIQAVRRGACFGTTGPLIDVRLGDAQPGDRFRGAAETLRISVRSASWIPVSSVRVFVDGELHAELPVSTPETVELELAFESDAFVTVEVRGAPSDVYADVLPGFQPLAFSNPIYVDADGDGQWSPPGPFGNGP